MSLWKCSCIMNVSIECFLKEKKMLESCSKAQRPCRNKTRYKSFHSPSLWQPPNSRPPNIPTNSAGKAGVWFGKFLNGITR